MSKDLIKVANKLESIGLSKEAAEELAEHKSESSIQYGVKEVEVYRLKRL